MVLKFLSFKKLNQGVVIYELVYVFFFFFLIVKTKRWEEKRECYKDLFMNFFFPKASQNLLGLELSSLYNLCNNLEASSCLS